MLEDSDQAKELACKRGHMHVQDIARLMTEKVHGDRSRQEWVLVHISARYDAATALRYAASAIPEKFHGNVWVSITALPEREQFSNVVESGMVKLSTYVS
mmetsp:Transcript_42198/g.59258  ORF Transcript_42198/g.59258 Transcript_42198/m.59258 type:complete len:100 (-) Transcript_42198:122-421(-)